MPYALDLHIHSKYARATSKSLEIPVLAEWAGYKGIDVLGTGDCLHPAWLEHLQDHIDDQGTGLYSYADSPVQFLLTVESSHMYKHLGKTRRVHIVTLFPDFESIKRVRAELLIRKVNLSSDGRPIMGLSVHNYCELVWSIEPRCFIIPAHIWTPWFSVFGSASGYDSLGDCFGEFEPRITAVETGLSSDPAMNWGLLQLQNKVQVSFSDAHSPSKIGREYTLYEGDLSYEGMCEAFGNYQGIGTNRIVGTVEFFPEEGKYHYDGHRNCNVCLHPNQSKEVGDMCPECNKQMTLGVLHRVEALKDVHVNVSTSVDAFGVTWLSAQGEIPYTRLVPLQEIIAGVFDMGIASKKVQSLYHDLVGQYGSERVVLLSICSDDLVKDGYGLIAKEIVDVRKGNVFVQPGFDGEFGVVRLKG